MVLVDGIQSKVLAQLPNYTHRETEAKGSRVSSRSWSYKGQSLNKDHGFIASKEVLFVRPMEVLTSR